MAESMVRKLKNASGKSGNQQDIIKQAQVMQQEMLKIQEGTMEMVYLLQEVGDIFVKELETRLLEKHLLR